MTTRPPTIRASLAAVVPDNRRGASRTESLGLEIPTITATAGQSRPLPPLPAELHLDIIDIIASRVPRSPCHDVPCDPADLETLCTCALVCKLWLSTARMGIWASVRLSSRKKSMAFVRLLRAYVRDAAWTIPGVGRYIARLSVRETRGNAWDPKWLDEALPHLAVHLSHVQSLEMERITWEYLSSRSRTACIGAFRNVKNLTLRGFVFYTTREMCDLLGEFTELEVLTLDGVQCATKNTLTWVGNTIKVPAKGLREVGLREVPMEPVLEWIMTGSEYQRGPGIKNVRMGGVGVSDAGIVGRFLKGVGDSLRRVHIGFETDFVERGDALVKEMALAENTSLEEFHIFGLVVPSPPPVDPYEDDSRPPQRALEALTLLLSQIRSRMRVLSLALYPADVRAMSVIDFEGLTRVFERRVWSCLDEVRVVISNKVDRGLGRVVKEGLNVLHERGVLQVNVGFDEREVL